MEERFQQLGGGQVWRRTSVEEDGCGGGYERDDEISWI
jgi:hypothetical protein